jgi:hypothetical protein
MISTVNLLTEKNPAMKRVVVSMMVKIMIVIIIKVTNKTI